MIFIRVFFLLITQSVMPHGLGADTLIWTGDWKNIQAVCEELVRERVDLFTPSYDIARGIPVSRAEFQQRIQDGWVRIKGAARSVTNCYIRITLGHRPHEIILCTPAQEFYVPVMRKWVPAIDLEIGDELLSEYSQSCPVLNIELITEPLAVYAISVEAPHAYFVSIRRVLTHNLLLPAIECTAAIPWDLVFAGGKFALELGPATCGISIALAAGAGVGYAIYRLSKGAAEIDTYCLSFDAKAASTYFHAKSEHDTGRAPGKPTEQDGYIPPKRWDGKKVKAPKGGQYGWPDKKGNVWIPSGEEGHGGPHWDVQDPDGGYKNVLPGGKIRGKK